MLYRIIVIYFIIVLVYFKVRNIENNKLEKFVFSLFIPIFGFLTVILAEYSKNLSKEENKTEKKNSDREKSKEYLTQIQSSLIDNLTIEDYENAREMVLYTKSLKLEEQCKICHLAIKSKNVEISHIAAVSLMKIQNYFERFLAHMELKTDLEKTENLKKYIDGVNRYLECKLVQGALRNKYREKLIQAIKYLLLTDKKCERKYYDILVNCFIDEAEYDKVMQYIKDEINIYGMNEETYRLFLKIYIKTRKIDEFYELLEKIKENSEMANKFDSVLEFWK